MRSIRMEVEGLVIECQTLNQWNREILLAENKLVVAYFTAPWCEPRRAMVPNLPELAKKFHNVIFLRADADNLMRLAIELEVERLPSFVFLKQGKVVDRLTGARKLELPEKIVLHMPKYRVLPPPTFS